MIWCPVHADSQPDIRPIPTTGSIRVYCERCCATIQEVSGTSKTGRKCYCYKNQRAKKCTMPKG